METLKPKLRFPEFKGNWEKKNLGEVAVKPKYGLNSSAKEYDGINGYIRITDIDELSRRFSNDKITSPDEFDNSYLLKEDDLLFTRTGASTGKSYLYNKKDGKLFFAGFLIKFPIDKANSKFIFYTTLLSQYDKWVKVMSVRSGQPGINAEEYSSLPLNIPSLPEQTRIAHFLSAIDEKLHLLKEKKGLLEEYKKGMMQKIFNQELRFKDDNGEEFGDWEEKKLKDYKELIHGDGNWILSKDLSLNGKYKLIQLGNVGFGSYVDKELKTISEDKFKEIKGTLLNKGDLLINRMVDNNLYCCILNNDGDFITSVDVCWIRANSMLNNYFLMSILLFKDNQIKLLNLSSGSGRVRISKSNLFNEFIFKMPSLKEQNKIAQFLSAIDDKIGLVGNQIEETVEYKKGLLQGMFV